MRWRLFLDANVLFTAAHNPSGKAAFLFTAEGLRHWRLLSSQYAIDEARRNLLRKYPTAVAALDRLLPSIEIAGQPATCPDAQLDLPAKDQPIWFAALSGRASHLLTGDLRDFGAHMNRPERCAGIVIQTVGDFLSSL